MKINYYTNVNGNWEFLMQKNYSNLTSPPRIDEKVELFIDDQTLLYTVKDVIYSDNSIKLYVG